MSLVRPVFKPHLRVQVVEPDKVFVSHDDGQTVLQSPLYAALAPRLDGTRSADEVVEELAHERDPVQLYYALERLEQGGFLSEASDALPLSEAAWWCSLGVDAGGVASLDVRVHSLCEDIDSGLLSIPRRPPGGHGGGVLDVVITDDYLRTELDGWNLRALADRRPWMLVKPVGTSLWIGPIVIPGETACWRCLADRLRGNREVEGFIQRKRATDQPIVTSVPALESTVATAFSLAASQISEAMAGGLANSSLCGRLLSLDLLSMASRIHEVDRRPQCAACGSREAVLPRPIELRSVATRHGDDGGHRSATPEETLRRLYRLVSPISGVVSFLEASPTLDGCAHVYHSGHNFARMNDEYYFLRASLRSQSAGKGASDAQARASAIGEAVERYSGVYRGDEVSVMATMAEMGESAISPNDCLLYSPRQYAMRDQQSIDYLGFNFVPRPFDPAERIAWTAVWSLTRREWRHLPTAFCYYGYPQSVDTAFCWADSNGNAAGNTLEEAILQGFLELVERDAIALWWYNRVNRPGVDLDKIDDPFVHRLRRYYRSDARDAWVLDITSDLGVPTYVALSRRLDVADEDIIMGFGSHPDALIAVRRALTEMNQSLSYVRLWAKERDSDDFDVDTVRWWKTATVANQPHLLPSDERRVPRSLDWGQDLADAVRAGQSLVESKGLEMLVLDQTRPDVGLSVVKVVVPGLRHFWARFAPGRLYDVPVQLGWLPAPLPEEQMNPIAMFL